VYIIICLLVIFTILCFIISKKNNSNILYGSYQSETTDPTIQIVVDRKFFTEYTNSKKTSEGTIHEEEKNVDILMKVIILKIDNKLSISYSLIRNCRV